MMDLDNSNNNNSPISNNIVVLLLAMGSAALVVSVYHIIAICCCHHQQLISAHQIQTQQQQQSAEQSTTSSVSHMIPSHKYHKIDDGGGTCAVCLGDFEEGEELKTLPECTHSFHVPCIDMWLHSHTSCPICRAAATPNSHGGGGGPPFHGTDGNHYAANQSIGMVQIAVVQNGLLPR